MTTRITPSFGTILLASALLLGAPVARPEEPPAPAPAAPDAEDPAAAAEAAREAAEKSPQDPALWKALAEAEWRLGAAAMESGDGPTAELRLADAKASSAKAVALAPKDPEAWRVRGRILRDLKEFPPAAEAFGKAATLGKGPDGDALYEQGFCLAYAGDFRGGLAAFRKAEAALGLQSRIAVNAAICEEKLGDRPAAVERLRKYYASEAAAGRARGADALKALEKTWDLTVVKRDFEAGKAALLALEKEAPAAPEPPFMLGNLLAFRADHAAAAEAYGRAVAKGGPPAARIRLARELVAAGRAPEAAAALREALALDPLPEGAAAAAVEIARVSLRGGKPAEAKDLLRAALQAVPADPDVLVAAGDAAFAAGDAAAALPFYSMAREESPLSTEVEAREARARLAVLRSGKEGGGDPAVFDPSGDSTALSEPSEMLVGFDESSVFLRAEGTKDAKVRDGAMVLGIAPEAAAATGTPGAAPPADPRGGGRQGGGGGRGGFARAPSGPLLRVEFYPFLDGRKWETLSFRAWTGGGKAGIRAAILDGYDEAGSTFARSRWPGDGALVPLGPKPVEVKVPLAKIEGFVPGRGIPPLIQRIRCFLLQAEPAKEDPAAQVHFDDLVLRGPKGVEQRLADFEEAAEETLVLYDGTIVPFERTLANESDVKGFVSPGTVVYAPHILVGAKFDPSKVGAGSASLRAHHGEAGGAPAGPFGRVAGAAPTGGAAVTVLLRPDRDLSSRKALTFQARGEKGGEKLRVRLVDAHDQGLADQIPAANRPSAVYPRTAGKDGVLVLAPEWRRYRIDFRAYPDLDWQAAESISFEFGDDVGNPSGTYIYLDSIGLE